MVTITFWSILHHHNKGCVRMVSSCCSWTLFMNMLRCRRIRIIAEHCCCHPNGQQHVWEQALCTPWLSWVQKCMFGNMLLAVRMATSVLPWLERALHPKMFVSSVHEQREQTMQTQPNTLYRIGVRIINVRLRFPDPPPLQKGKSYYFFFF